jgi:hypothetical protein
VARKDKKQIPPRITARYRKRGDLKGREESIVSYFSSFVVESVCHLHIAEEIYERPRDRQTARQLRNTLHHTL